MSISSKHPLYAEYLEDWQQMRDTYAGERKVKERGTRYLSATSGMHADGMGPNDKGTKAYEAYRKRARYPELVEDAVQSILGVMHNKPPSIELPKSLEYLNDRATLRGESLEMLLQRINEEQLVTGRLGLIGDIETSGAHQGQFYLATYCAEHAINWDEGQSEGIDRHDLNVVVLDESTDERDNFTWQAKRRHRVLLLGKLMENEAPGEAAYRVGVFDDDAEFNESALATPVFAGKAATEIPFVFINALDVVAEPDRPPLLGLSNLALAIYRGEADYRQSLFMQGQDTLVVIGSVQNEDEEIRTGAGARIDLPASQYADAKYIGVNSDGLPEQRSALENDYNRGAQKAGQLLDSVSRERESGDALKIRVAARTATLNRVALAGAFGMQMLLRKLARWSGADPEEAIVTPNLDFVDDAMTGSELLDRMDAKSSGAPYSLQSIHEQMVQRGMTTKTFEEELKAIEDEQDLEFVQMNRGSTNPNGPADDPMPGEGEDEEEPEPAGAASGAE